MKKFLFIILTIFCLASCKPYYFYDDYDWYYDRGPKYLAHYISTNGNIYYIRTCSCPRITYDNYCWDYDYLILRSNGPITVHHIHNGYR